MPPPARTPAEQAETVARHLEGHGWTGLDVDSFVEYNFEDQGEWMKDQEQNEGGAAVWFPPPLVYVLSILLGVGLQKVWPLPFPISRDSSAFALVMVPFVLGAASMVAGLGSLVRTGQNPEPWKPSPELVVEGIYRWTRNPIYLGMALIQLSVGIGLYNAWVILGTPLSMLGVFRIAIRPEEIYLESKFGDDYRRYRSSVRRWLGRRSSRHGEPT